jgi:hypothetical protein
MDAGAVFDKVTAWRTARARIDCQSRACCSEAKHGKGEGEGGMKRGREESKPTALSPAR